MTARAIPNTSSAIYKAAALIDVQGPMFASALFEAVDFGIQAERMNKLRHAFDLRWLCETPAGTVDLTENSRQHFVSRRPKEKYIGQIVPAQYRPNVFASPGLSKKNIPSRRGQRDDIPAWSVRANPTFQTKA